MFFFFNDTATTEIYTLSLHERSSDLTLGAMRPKSSRTPPTVVPISCERSEEHTSELQSQSNLVCRLLLEKKNNHLIAYTIARTPPYPVLPFLSAHHSPPCLIVTALLR